MNVTVDRDATLLQDVRAIADDIAAVHADDVDRRARFPHEAIDALRERGALSAFLPIELGGEDIAFETLAAACFELGRRCASTGMVFAMHQIQVVTIARHHEDEPWLTAYLRRVADEQRLIASVTSELGTGGDMGRSVAALTPTDSGPLTFEKQAPTVSYGEQAQDLLVSLRRAPDAEPTDQVAVLAGADQVQLEPAGSWDPLGMRGTCSPGFTVRGTVDEQQVLPRPFSHICAQSMVPVSHILWSHVWLGIATDAFDRARAFVRASAARSSSTAPIPAALRLSRLSCALSPLRAETYAGLRDFLDFARDDGEALNTMAAAVRFNQLKVTTSDMAPAICQGALGVCGMMGYKNDSPFSIGRHIRDALSGSLMISNERLHEVDADLLLVAKDVR
ncbi:MAG: acyl-CoA dehydrogenase [Solirubrobacterales bacterium]|nr:acyl-CoA dehydrogenase [Solirubrobacterales bacterium]